MGKIGYNQGNNPFKRKKSPFNKQEGGFWNNYIDIDGDGKASAWEYGVEAATWIPTAIAAIGGTATTGVGGVPAAAATKTGIKQLIKRFKPINAFRNPVNALRIPLGVYMK